MIPFAGAMLITSESKTERAFYPLTFASLAICLIFTWSRGAWLGFMVSALLFVLIWSRKFMVAGMFGLLAVLYFLLFCLIILCQDLQVSEILGIHRRRIESVYGAEFLKC